MTNVIPCQRFWVICFALLFISIIAETAFTFKKSLNEKMKKGKLCNNCITLHSYDL